jgi:hypothetical protein
MLVYKIRTQVFYSVLRLSDLPSLRSFLRHSPSWLVSSRLNFQGFDRLRVRQTYGLERSGVNTVNGAGDGRDFTTDVGSNDGLVFDSGKMAGIFSE